MLNTSYGQLAVSGLVGLGLGVLVLGHDHEYVRSVTEFTRSTYQQVSEKAEELAAGRTGASSEASEDEVTMDVAQNDDAADVADGSKAQAAEESSDPKPAEEDVPMVVADLEQARFGAPSPDAQRRGAEIMAGASGHTVADASTSVPVPPTVADGSLTTDERWDLVKELDQIIESEESKILAGR